MKLQFTNKCLMGCSHCGESSNSAGEHMSTEIFNDSLKFIHDISPKVLLVSGGEPTEHPDWYDMLTRLKCTDPKVVLLLSNGMFIEDSTKLDMVKKLNIKVQITNDKRYYPKRIKIIENSNFMYVNNITHISPFGRAIDNGIESTRQAPICFNLRSICSKVKSFRESVSILESYMKFCVPTICVNGDVLMGEFNSCYKIGTIYNSNKELTDNLMNAKCNKCGLYDKLHPMYKAIVGE